MKPKIEVSMLESVRPIRDIVYDLLRKAILEGDIKPGEHIVENEYAEMLNTSRTPIREALRRLETEGFVEYVPRKGVIVKGFSLKDIIEIYEIRKSLESLAMRHAVRNITDNDIVTLERIVETMEKAHSTGNIEELVSICQKFHDTLLMISSMPRLKTMINTLQEYLEAFKRATLGKESRRKNAIAEHREIFLAVAQRDAVKAEEQIIRHIEASKRSFLENYKISLE